MTNNILVIGSSAREHIIISKLKASQQQSQIYCFATHANPSIQKLCTQLEIGDLNDANAIVDFVINKNIDFAFIGPEAPLEKGIADALKSANIPCIGPTQKLAKIESSKSFTRQLLKDHAVDGTPYFKKFDNMDGIKETLSQLGDEYVIKADGLMGGKGVKLSGEHLHSHTEALDFCQEIFSKKQAVVIEEKLIGEEFSLLSFVDGEHYLHMPIVQDHKRAFNDDAGPNTGGMGTYSCADHLLPFIDKNDVITAQKISEHCIQVLQQHCQQTYCGILYGSFMLTQSGIKLIEYNARFGDPEVLNLLSLLESDFLELCQHMLSATLNKYDAHFQHQATVCKYLVPEGYPSNPKKNSALTLAAMPEAIACYDGAVIQQHDHLLLMTGSRAIALVASADNTQQASDLLEEYIKNCNGDFFHRSDIGQNTLINRRIKHINNVCGRSYPLL